MPIKKKRNETAIVKEILDDLHLNYKNECFAWRNNTGGLPTPRGGFMRFGYTGSSDIFMIPKKAMGRFVGIEVKDGDGKQEPEQKLFQKHIEEMGGEYILVWTHEECMNELRTRNLI